MTSKLEPVLPTHEEKKIDFPAKTLESSIHFKLDNDKTQQVKRTSILYEHIQEYCEQSGLHGIKYVGGSDRTLLERLWWSVAILVSLLAISWLIYRVWDRWTTSPVIVSFADTPTPIWQIPFPTVTVCPQVKYQRALVDRRELEANQHLLNDTQTKLLTDVIHICGNVNEDSIRNGNYPNFTDQSTIDNFIKIAHDTDIIECNYLYGSSCEKSLQKIITKDGVCFAFNLKPNMSIYTQYAVQRGNKSTRPQVEYWSLEGGYTSSAGISDPPFRAAGTGFQMALNLLLKTDLKSLDYECRMVQGYKISLSNPAEAPRMFERFFYVPMKGLTQLVVEPKVMETSDALRSYSPDKRHCFLPSERTLAFFTTYTQNNCDLECLTNLTVKLCGCVDYYMPRNYITPICGLGRKACVEEAEMKLSEYSMHESIKHITNEDTCNCLPECKSIQYNAQVSQGTYEIMKVAKAQNLPVEKYVNYSVNYVFIFFKDSEFYASRRGELYGYADFMANCGGLLGLACGFSILSLVEIVYYFTLRLWSNIRRSQNNYLDKGLDS